MKKFGKFLFGTLSLAAVAGGLYCLYKNHVNKDNDEDFDDFDDSLEEDEMEEDTAKVDPESREYVSITITAEDAAKADAESEEENVSVEDVNEETADEN